MVYQTQSDNERMNNRIHNVGVYTRLSREDGDEKQSESIDNQKDFISRYVQDQGWNITQYYVDDGYTGTNFDRPSFKKLIKDIEQGKINTIVTKDLSRLGRDYIGTGEYLERYFPTNKIRYIAINDGIDTFTESSNNDMSPFRSVINDMYAKDISKKVCTVMNTKRHQGKFIGAYAPYGYTKDPINKSILIIDKTIDTVVKRIFHMYINGSGYTQIAHVLNGEGIKCPSAYKKEIYENYNNPKAKLELWTAHTIRSILISPTYIGHIAQNKYKKVNYKVKKLITIPKNYWTVVENTHAAIVDADTFAIVQQLMEHNNTKSYAKHTDGHLLTGFLFCGDCGERITFMKNPSGKMYCICSKYKRFGKGYCSRHSISESLLESTIKTDLSEMASRALNQENLLEVTKGKAIKNQGNDLQSRIDELNKKLADIKLTIKRLYEDKLKGVIGEDDFIDLSKSFGKEREVIANALEKFQEEQIKIEGFENGSDELQQYIKQFTSFDHLNRFTLAKLVEKIEIFEDQKIIMHYKFKKPI